MIKKILSFALLAGMVSCSSPPLKAPVIASEDQEMQFWQSRKKLVKEADLFNSFPVASDHFEVFQLVCEQNPEANKPQCSYRNQPQTMSKGAKSIKMNPANSAKLFSLLINLPIPKGETGVSLDYLGCRRFRDSDKAPWNHYCTVAAPVGLIPHTSLPINDLPDEL